MKIAIIDYGAGNLHSVAKAVARVGYQTSVTSEPREVLKAEAAIFPGVGAAGEAMRRLKLLGLDEALREVVARDRPLLGVCLGLQLLFEESEEGGGKKGLGLLPGKVRRLPAGLKVPHMGWNQVSWLRPHPCLKGIPRGAYFYFVHSYYAQPEDPSLTLGETDYGLTFCSAVARGNLLAVQFHPEKSGEVGLEIYRNFLQASLG